MEKMTGRPNIYKINTVIDCAVGQADEMGVFYSKLLGWQFTHPAANGWSAITSPTGAVYAFQEIEEYIPPVWPPQNDHPGQMMHLDYYVEDLQAAVEYALSIGATMASQQYFHSSRTLLDPAGHPFCLDTDEPEP